VGAADTSQDEIAIGPIAVRTGADDITAFGAALGLQRGFGPVPLSFPIRWLSLPAIRPVVIQRLGLAGEAIVQQSQTFNFHDPLAADRDYNFEVLARRERTPADRTILQATVRDAAGATTATLTTLLRTFRPGAARADPPRSRSVPESEFPVFVTGPVDLAQTERYAAASLDDNPLHSDIAAARAAGLDGLIIHGMLAMGQMEGPLHDWLPRLRIDRFHGNFLWPVPVGSRLSFSGRIARRRPGGRGEGRVEELVLRVIVSTDAGDAACIGEITARHPG
jgi:acyl dehydratase